MSIKAFVMTAALSGLVAPSGSGEDLTVKVGGVAPDFQAKWLNHTSSKGSLSELGGRIVFIEVWRTW